MHGLADNRAIAAVSRISTDSGETALTRWSVAGAPFAGRAGRIAWKFFSVYVASDNPVYARRWLRPASSLRYVLYGTSGMGLFRVGCERNANNPFNTLENCA